jgi:hypothetical protein
MAAPQHSAVGPLSAAGAVGFAAVPWVANLEIVLRISASAVALVVGLFTLYHYYSIYLRKKS